MPMPCELPEKSRTCCFAGHRPRPDLPAEDAVRRELQTELRQALNDGFTAFICGMAFGFDLLAAEEVLHLREEGLPVALIAAMPHKGFGDNWPLCWRQRRDRVFCEADRTVYVRCESFGKGVYQLRNRWMADRSARVIALYLGGEGGTWNMLRYCLKTGVEVRLLRIEGAEDDPAPGLQTTP